MNLENNISSAANNGNYSRWTKESGNRYSIGNIENEDVYIAGRGFNESKTDSGMRNVLLNIIKAVIIYTLLVYMNNDIRTNIIHEYINRVVLSSTKSEVVAITDDFMRNITVWLFIKIFYKKLEVILL